MSKVICDVCGTTYPETASVCPICGCAKNTTAQTAADSAQPGESVSTYTYVKGGRFSKKNVRKHNQSGKDFRRGSEKGSKPDGVNKELVVVVLILLLAIVAVLVYIGVTYFVPHSDPKPNGTENTQQTGDTGPTGSSEPTAPAEVPCTAVKLSSSSIELSAEGTVWLLSVETEPANTTDKITFDSSDERVATVSENGNITAVAGGETVITVTCGDITAECKVICTFGDPVEPTGETTEPSVQIPEGFVLKLNREDFTLSEEGATWTLFRETDGVKASDITWTVDDPEVATVEDGKVTGVDYGDTVVRATLGDQTVSCAVRVRFNAGEGDETGGIRINKKDVTIAMGETFTLTLTDSEGVKINVEWEASEEGFVSIDGTRITGVADTTSAGISVSATYEDVTYTCIVRVRTPQEDAE